MTRGADLDPMRRCMLAALASLPAGCAVADPVPPDRNAAPPASTAVASTRPGTGILVAWLSRSGNTRVIAGVIARRRKADVFEIRTATPYPDDYFETVAQAKRERDGDMRPVLAARVDAIAAYDLVYLGFPVWGGTLPPPVHAFLADHDLSGKRLVPFLTHGGYGSGDCLDALAALAPGARILPAFVLEADQERRTTERVDGWLQTG